MQGFTVGAVPARRQERSRHTFEMVSPIVRQKQVEIGCHAGAAQVRVKL